MRTLRMTVEYDGRRFHGWQRQSTLRTVQGELEGALATILRHPVTLHAAGRTDAGVHALAQVVSLRSSTALEPARIRAGANALTGEDVVVRDVVEVEDGFHARHSARARHYLYLLIDQPSALWAGRALPLRYPVDLAAMNAAGAHLIGEHDFSGFALRTPEETDRRSRVLYVRWESWARGVALRVGAVRFLHRMVRCIVGRSLAVGRGRCAPEQFAALLADPRARAQQVVGPDGLYLVAVDYEESAGSGGPDCLPPWPVL